MAILEVRGLRKSFGKLEVLKGIDLSLEQGQVLSIICLLYTSRCV